MIRPLPSLQTIASDISSDLFLYTVMLYRVETIFNLFIPIVTYDVVYSGSVTNDVTIIFKSKSTNKHQLQVYLKKKRKKENLFI